MNIRQTITLLAVLLLALPGAVLAASHGMDHSKMEHGKMEQHDMAGHGEHGGMAMSGDMIMLGEAEVEGVEGMAHLKDVKQAMAKMGMPTTHHFMIMFVNEESGEPIETGKAALKVTTPSGETGKAIKLMGMQGHFGADVTLAEKGMYRLEVGTKLADGKKRQFQFEFHNH